MPTKKINDSKDVTSFKKSLTYKKLHDTMSSIVMSVKGIEVPSGVLDSEILIKARASQPQSRNELPPTLTSLNSEISSEAKQVLQVLEYFTDLIKETPPIEGPRRFGNFAFKTWSSKLQAADSYLTQTKIFKVSPQDYEEMKYYLLSSFGSPVRLDFGTGHELSFIAFLGILFESYKFSGIELVMIFSKYYDLVRKLILVYNLEPAGSHGVWGLDDHFHFIYILGAAQFNDAKFQVPPISQCLSELVISEYKLTNLYINAIGFIQKIKSGPFREHSPIIYDIHQTVTLWKKVLSGLLKMYDVEVFGKFPVVQHFYFGKFYPWKDMNGNNLPESEDLGFIEDSGVKTTDNNINTTAAPWANPIPRNSRR